MSAPKFLYLTYGTWEEGFDPEAYWSKEEDDDVTYVRGDLYDKLRESLAAKERECEELQNAIVELWEQMSTSQVLAASDHIFSIITHCVNARRAALAEGGEG